MSMAVHALRVADLAADSDALGSPDTVLHVFRFPTTSAEEGATYPPFSIETLMTIAAVGAVVINAAGAAP